ncbi:MAG: hypothetical protein EOP61_10695 [Sphingomonadales bacterium]|nr:MAG: hypothetical protein EOP61_10695 [Sphingomonadales bacterium]
MRVLIEVLHILVGLLVAVLIAALCAWSYPLAKHDIWLVTYVAMVAIVAMGVGPLRRAYALDKAKLGGTPADG